MLLRPLKPRLNRLPKRRLIRLLKPRLNRPPKLRLNRLQKLRLNRPPKPRLNRLPKLRLNRPPKPRLNRLARLLVVQLATWLAMFRVWLNAFRLPKTSAHRSWVNGLTPAPLTNKDVNNEKRDLQKDYQVVAHPSL